MNTTRIIIAREFVERIRQKSFIISTALGVIFIIALSFFPLIFQQLGRSTATKIAVVAPDASAKSAISRSLSTHNYRLTFLPERARKSALPPGIKKALDRGSYDAALVGYRTGQGVLGFTYYPKKSGALEEQSALKNALLKAVLLAGVGRGRDAAVAQALSYQFDVVNLNERYKSGVDEIVTKGIVYFLLIILYIAVLMYGVYVAHGVIEEKANRVMEIMIGAVRPAQLLAGKIFGIGAVALVQLIINGLTAGAMTVIAALHATHAAPAAGAAGGVPNIVTVPPMILVYLLVFFLLGFFTNAALFAGIGALLTKPEEVQQYSSVFMMPIIGAYILAIYALANPDLPLVVWCSMIPIVSPMLMFARVATVSVPWWQLVISIGASLAAIWLFTLAAGKLYRIGVLMYGKPPRPVEIWRALKADA